MPVSRGDVAATVLLDQYQATRDLMSHKLHPNHSPHHRAHVDAVGSRPIPS